jgi:hypothetical protein
MMTTKIGERWASARCCKQGSVDVTLLLDTMRNSHLPSLTFRRHKPIFVLKGQPKIARQLTAGKFGKTGLKS